MSLFDFFFPDVMQASHLRRIADQQERDSRRATRSSHSDDKRIRDLEDDLGFVTLVLGAILETLDSKGIVTRDNLRETIHALDSLDGVRDGRLDIDLLRRSHE